MNLLSSGQADSYHKISYKSPIQYMLPTTIYLLPKVVNFSIELTIVSAKSLTSTKGIFNFSKLLNFLPIKFFMNNTLTDVSLSKSNGPTKVPEQKTVSTRSVSYSSIKFIAVRSTKTDDFSKSSQFSE